MKKNKKNDYVIADAYVEYKNSIKRFPDREPVIVEYKLYRKIVVEFTKLIILMIYKGIKFPIPFAGRLCLLRKERQYVNKHGKISLSPDWGESNKRKKEIIDKGGIPYQEWWELDGKLVERETEGAVRKDNGGEKWVVFRNDDHYYRFEWNKRYNSKFYIWHLTGYSFKACRPFARNVKFNLPDLPELFLIRNGLQNNYNETLINQCFQKFWVE